MLTAEPLLRAAHVLHAGELGVLEYLHCATGGHLHDAAWGDHQRAVALRVRRCADQPDDRFGDLVGDSHQVTLGLNHDPLVTLWKFVPGSLHRVGTHRLPPPSTSECSARYS